MLKSITAAYAWVGRVLFNAAVLFLILNIAALFIWQPTDGLDPALNRSQWLQKHGIEAMRRVYPGKSDAEIEKLMLRTQRFGLVFAPYIHMKSEPSVVEHTAFHEAGFRLIGKDQGPWPIDPKALNVFVFGGSTTVGSGVQDNQTIPAALQRHLRTRLGRADINVYNFGTAGHYSTQERIYFEQLVLHNHRPDVAVFVDGLNDFNFWDDRPSNTTNLENCFTGMATLSNPRRLGETLWVFAQQLPITNLLRVWMRRSETGMPAASLIGTAHAAENPYADPTKIDMVIKRYLNNKAMTEAIAERFKITPLFVWPPAPLYKYPPEQRLAPVTGDHRRHEFGYPAARAEFDRRGPDNKLAWCADLFENATRPMYLDVAHYTAESNDIIAGCIAGTLIDHGLLAPRLARGPLSEGQPTR